MQKKHFTTLLFLLLPFCIYAQRTPLLEAKCGDIWMHGYSSYAHSTQPNFGVSDTDFGICNLHQEFNASDLDINSTIATIADTAGKLLFFTNGYTIGDRSRHKMLNGDSLCMPDWTYPNGSYAIQGAIIMPVPDKPYLYKIFHHTPRIRDSVSIVWVFLETTVDIRGNQGKGVVVSKNVLRLKDTCNGVFFKFCRHANGRDWWMIRAGWSMSTYHRFLLTPNGLDSLPPQTLPYPPALQRGNYGATNAVCYSPDGTKLAHKAPRVGIWLYDFDRCSGMVSNRRLIPYPIYGGNFFAGIAFSPNSRYLYRTIDTAVVQYDTEAPDIAASAVIVGVRDGALVNGMNTMFYVPTLAPDGKIYITGQGGCQMWHTIHNPDGAGLSCDLRLHDRTLSTLYYATTPNQANFRLGALVGSPCDTLNRAASAPYICVPYLATESPLNHLKENFLQVFPNPASNVLNIAYEAFQNKQIILTDLLGIQQKTLSLQSETTIINIQNLHNGIYYVNIYENNRLLDSRKLVILHE